MINKHTISVKFDYYTNLFYDFDNSPINNRLLSDDLDTFIRESIKDIENVEDIENIDEANLSLIVSLPNNIFDEKIELLVKEGVSYFYKSKIELDQKISVIGRKRVFYYIGMSFIFFTIWSFVQNYVGDTFFSGILDTSATVILWQAISLIFIENKNYKLTKKINKMLSNMEIVFKYYD